MSFLSKNRASHVYFGGESPSSGTAMSAVPRNKFDFQVEVKFSGSLASLKLNRISEVQLPSHIFKTVALNQYNRKRITNVGVDYTPVYFVAYDTYDNFIQERLLKPYADYYYKGIGTSTGTVEKNYGDVVNNFFVGGNSGKGLNIVPHKNFIEQIDIIRSETTTSLFAPMITGVSADTLSYDSSAPVQYRIELAYEGYNVSTSGKPFDGE